MTKYIEAGAIVSKLNLYAQMSPSWPEQWASIKLVGHIALRSSDKYKLKAAAAVNKYQFKLDPQHPAWNAK